MTRFIHAGVMAALLSLATRDCLHAQIKLTDNEPVKGRLGGKLSEGRQFLVESKQDEKVLKFRLQCHATEIFAEVSPEGGKPIRLLTEKGKPWPNNRAQGKGAIVASTDPLAAKKYTIKVWVKKGESGPFSLTVIEPSLGGAAPKAGDGDAKAELKKLREDFQELLKRLERLEKLMEEKK